MVVKYICSHKCFQRDTTEVPAGKKGGGEGRKHSSNHFVCLHYHLIIHIQNVMLTSALLYPEGQSAIVAVDISLLHTCL